ncbi:MAG: aminotransferase class V-fold PLP-dependent enzyme, partial [Planctomycetes bacterium]|nr:aminotransferase class V-fold PLP-dependent enzyme [Planctomycetota bacterium]
MSLDPDLDSMRAQGHLAVDLLVDWLAELPRAPVARMPDARWLAQLVGEPLPTAPGSVEDSMRHFMTELMPFATLVNHPRFFAYIPCPGSYVGALGALLAAGTNLFTGSWLGGAVAAQLEEQVLEWVREALALPIGFRGVITSGGSLANLSGLAAARARVAEADWNRTTVYVSQATHHSVAKAARLLGITGDRVRNIPVDAGQRMVPEPLRASIAADRLSGRVPMLVCGTLGTTTTGAIDPLDAMVEVCRAEGVWLHVDGAYGAAMALLPESRDALRALEAADSITLDPHKWLYAPFECGCFLTRHLDALRRAFAADG